MFVRRLKWVLKDCYIVMRCFSKSLLLLLENFHFELSTLKNSILIHDMIDKILSFIFTTLYYYFKVNQRNLL